MKAAEKEFVAEDAPGVDGTIKPEALDPTLNVQNMLLAAVTRIDDLRDADTKLMASEIKCLGIEIKRIDQLREQAERFHEKLREAEKSRIDAIRAVDASQVTRAAEVAAQQASTLASQVLTSADTLRQLVDRTASAQATSGSATANQLSDRISAIERSQYEGVGKGRVSDPMMAELVAEVKRLAAQADRGEGKTSITDPSIAFAIEKMSNEMKAMQQAALQLAQQPAHNNPWPYIVAGIFAFLFVLTLIVGGVGVFAFTRN